MRLGTHKKMFSFVLCAGGGSRPSSRSLLPVKVASAFSSVAGAAGERFFGAIASRRAACRLAGACLKRG